MQLQESQNFQTEINVHTVINEQLVLKANLGTLTLDGTKGRTINIGSKHMEIVAQNGICAVGIGIRENKLF